MEESEWQTRKQRIDAKLRSINPPTEAGWIFDARSNERE